MACDPKARVRQSFLDEQICGIFRSFHNARRMRRVLATVRRHA
jgi:hypothetical protein